MELTKVQSGLPLLRMTSEEYEPQKKHTCYQIFVRILEIALFIFKKRIFLGWNSDAIHAQIKKKHKNALIIALSKKESEREIKRKQ